MAEFARNIIVTILIALLAITSINVSTIISHGERGIIIKRALLIISPCIDLDLLLNATKDLLNISKDTLVYEVRSMPPYNALYYELSVITGTLWDLNKGVPEDRNKIRVGYETKEAWSVVNQTLIDLLWRGENTSFIMVHGISPKYMPRSINVDVNMSDKVIIPPTWFYLKPNETFKWNIINATIKVIVSGNKTSIEVSGKKVDVSKNETTSPIEVDVKGGLVEDGKYRLVFRVVKYNETHYFVFTPGTIKSDHGFSEGYSGFTRPITPHIPFNIIGKVDKETFLWTVNKTIGFYISVIRHALSKYTQPITIINYPLIEEVKRSRELLGNLYNDTLHMVYKGLVEVARKAIDWLGKDNTVLIIFSPYNIVYGKGYEPRFKYTLADGIIKYSKDILLKLVDEGIKFTIKDISGRKYIIISDPRKVYGNGYRYDYGLLIIKPSAYAGVKEADIETVFGFIASLSRIYGIGFADTLTFTEMLHVKVMKLKGNISSMNSTIRSLRKQLDEMTKRYGEANAEKEKLVLKIDELKSSLEEERRKYRSLLIYSTIGLASIALIMILYSVVIKWIVSRRSR